MILKIFSWCMIVFFGLLFTFEITRPALDMAWLGVDILFLCLFLWLAFRKKKDLSKSDGLFSKIGKSFGKFASDVQNNIKKYGEEEEAVCSALTEGADIAIAKIRNLPAVQEATDKDAAVTQIAKRYISKVVDRALSDGILTEDEQLAIAKLIQQSGIKEIDDSLADKLRKASIVRDLLNGTVRPMFTFDSLPFQLQKNETVIWGWNDIEVYITKTKREWQSGSRGVGIKVAKGVYFRVGNHRGQMVSSDYQEKLGRGLIVVTNKNLYVNAGGQAERIDLDKLLTVEQCKDGVYVTRDGRGKPLAFLTNDAWFMTNCISNAQNWS